MSWRLLPAIALLLIGCDDTDPGFTCDRNDQCALNGVGGICVMPIQRCAVVAADCPSGYRFHSSAGNVAGQCTMPLDMGAPDMSAGFDASILNPSPDMSDLPPDFAGYDAGPKGLTWSLRASGTTSELYGGVASGANAWAAGSGNTIVTTADDGVSWTSQTTGADASVSQLYSGMWAASSSELFLVGIASSTSNSPIIYHTTNGGGLWTAQALPTRTGTAVALRAVSGTSATNLFAVGDGGRVLNSGNAGATWVDEASPGSGASLRSAFVAATTVYAVGGNSIYKSTDSGGHWTSQSPVSTNLYAIWGSSDVDLWAVGSAGVILRATDGQTWNSVQMGTNNDLTSVWGSDAGNVFIVGSGGVILHFYDGSVHFEISGVTKTLDAVFGTGQNDVYATGAGGTIVHGQ